MYENFNCPSWQYQQQLKKRTEAYCKKFYPLMSSLLKTIQAELAAHSTPEAKAATLRFVPGATKVYGI